MYWCLGTYGSASTWTFNVVQKLAGMLAPERPVVPHFVNDSLDELNWSAGTLVVKSHATTAAAELARRARAIIITIRDPRDSLASLMAHNKVPLDIALDIISASAQLCARYAKHERAVLLRFDDRFFDDPATIRKLATLFDGTLPDADLQRIFAETRREEIEKFIAGMDQRPTVTTFFNETINAEDTLDDVTGWHKHHAGRKGEDGRWRRELSASEVGAIEHRLRKWMVHFGYPPQTSQLPPYVLSVGRFEISR
jgi:hypothetical protein